MEATTAVAQTLTCTVGEVVIAVDVIWIDSNGAVIRPGQRGYTIDRGIVNEYGNVQLSTLTIAPSIVSSFGTSSTVTYQCSARSALYLDSDASPFQILEVTFSQGNSFSHT